MKRAISVLCAGIATVLTSVAAADPILVRSGGDIVIASAVVTHPPYSADRAAERDATPSIQSAIDSVAEAGGGVVYIPSGRYRIDGRLNVRYGVTLQGDWSPPPAGIGKGTILLARSGRGQPESAPLLTMEPESGVVGLTIYYPEQSPQSIVPYPPTISAAVATVQRVTLCNSYYGILMSPQNAAVISDVYGTALSRGIFLPEALEFSWVYNVRFSPEYWALAASRIGSKALTDTERSAVSRFVRTNLTGMETQRLDGLALYRYSSPGARTPLLVSMNPKYPNPVFGLGGVIGAVSGERVDCDWAPWYYGMRYADLDRVPEAAGKSYDFAPTPTVRRPALIDVRSGQYQAVGDGVADDTAALQRALAAAGHSGGGVVYLPPGRYRITSPLVVPTGVELRGPYGVGKRRNWRDGCAIEVCCGAGSRSPETDPAAITLQRHAGIRGLSIRHPEQNYGAQVATYPYAIRGAGEGVWIVDIDLVDSDYGIDISTSRCDRSLVRGVWGSVIHCGLTLGGGSEGVHLERVAFSYGPWIESGAFAAQRTPERTQTIVDMVRSNAVYYRFGGSRGTRAWGLVGFNPKTQFLFTRDAAGDCADAEFWHTMHDVAMEVDVDIRDGRQIAFYGYFGTGWGDNRYNWVEVGDGVVGPVDFLAPTVQQTFLNHPVDASRVHLHPESSLITGREVTASHGANPGATTDRDPTTYWSAPDGASLQVDLGRTRTITGFGIVSASLCTASTKRVSRAELMVSRDGVNFTPAGSLSATDGANDPSRPFSVAGAPVAPVESRYVRLTLFGVSGQDVDLAEFQVYGR